ncbi:MAG: DUF5683 domain-containing protein [Edaphocola sp.]
MAAANAATDTTPFLTPKKIALFSAMCPGLGQIKNKDYWKLPIIYAGVGVAVYFLYDNSKGYNKFRRAAAAYQNGDYDSLDDLGIPDTDDRSEYITYYKDYYKRYLDMTALLTALGYTLQIVDAAVFAHLKNFDISEDISLRLRPVLLPNGGLGMGLVMRF